MTHGQQEPGKEILLAIECAVGSGSVAVFADGYVVASTKGQECRASRAEEVLAIIDQLLKNADITVNKVRRIVVAAGPGSYSGIRIGLATALGLKHSLSVSCTVIPLLPAMAASLDSTFLGLTVAVPVGKKDVAWQHFGENAVPVGDPELASETEFLDSFSGTLPRSIFAHTGLMRLRAQLSAGIRMVDAGEALAEYLGTFALRNPESGLSRPLYLRNRSHTGQIPM